MAAADSPLCSVDNEADSPRLPSGDEGDAAKTACSQDRDKLGDADPQSPSASEGDRAGGVVSPEATGGNEQSSNTTDAQPASSETDVKAASTGGERRPKVAATAVAGLLSRALAPRRVRSKECTHSQQSADINAASPPDEKQSSDEKTTSAPVEDVEEPDASPDSPAAEPDVFNDAGATLQPGLWDCRDIVQALCFVHLRSFIITLEAELLRLLESPRGAILRLPALSPYYRLLLESQCKRFRVQATDTVAWSEAKVDITSTLESRLPLPAEALLPDSWAGVEPQKWRKCSLPHAVSKKPYLEMVMTPGHDFKWYTGCNLSSTLSCPSLKNRHWETQPDWLFACDGEIFNGSAVLTLQLGHAPNDAGVGIALFADAAAALPLLQKFEDKEDISEDFADKEDPYVIHVRGDAEEKCWRVQAGKARCVFEGKASIERVCPWSHGTKSQMWVAVNPPDEEGLCKIEFGTGSYPWQKVFMVEVAPKGDAMQQFALAGCTSEGKAYSSILRGMLMERSVWRDRASRDHIVFLAWPTEKGAQPDDLAAADVVKWIPCAPGSEDTEEDAPEAPRQYTAVCKSSMSASVLASIAEAAGWDVCCLGNTPINEISVIGAGDAAAGSSNTASTIAASKRALMRRADEAKKLKKDSALDLGLCNLALEESPGETEEMLDTTLPDAVPLSPGSSAENARNALRELMSAAPRRGPRSAPAVHEDGNASEPVSPSIPSKERESQCRSEDGQEASRQQTRGAPPGFEKRDDGQDQSWQKSSWWNDKKTEDSKPEEDGPTEEDAEVAAWFQDKGMGFLKLANGREVYIHRSVYDNSREGRQRPLEVGTRLRVLTKPDTFSKKQGRLCVSKVVEWLSPPEGDSWKEDIPWADGSKHKEDGWNTRDKWKHEDDGWKEERKEEPRPEEPVPEDGVVVNWDEIDGRGILELSHGRRAPLHRADYEKCPGSGSGQLKIGTRLRVFAKPDPFEDNPKKLFVREVVEVLPAHDQQDWNSSSWEHSTSKEAPSKSWKHENQSSDKWESHKDTEGGAYWEDGKEKSYSSRDSGYDRTRDWEPNNDNRQEHHRSSAGSPSRRDNRKEQSPSDNSWHDSSDSWHKGGQDQRHASRDDWHEHSKDKRGRKGNSDSWHQSGKDTDYSSKEGWHKEQGSHGYSQNGSSDSRSLGGKDKGGGSKEDGHDDRHKDGSGSWNRGGKDKDRRVKEDWHDDSQRDWSRGGNDREPGSKEGWHDDRQKDNSESWSKGGNDKEYTRKDYQHDDRHNDDSRYEDHNGQDKWKTDGRADRWHKNDREDASTEPWIGNADALRRSKDTGEAHGSRRAKAILQESESKEDNVRSPSADIIGSVVNAKKEKREPGQDVPKKSKMLAQGFLKHVEGHLQGRDLPRGTRR